MDVRSWLRSLDLEKYADAFEENELEWSDLPELTSDDLKEELGVRRLPDRKKLLQAIEDLGGEAPTGEVTATSPAPEPPEDTVPEAAPPAEDDKPRAKPARTLTGRQKAAVPSDPYVGKTVGGRYRVDAPIGAPGPGGQVYRATHTDKGAAVALKVIPSELTGDAASVDSYRDVATRAGGLSGDGFLTVHEFGDADGGDKFLITDYVGGSSLSDALAASGSLEPSTALDIARRVATALETAHGAGLFHGDLKPANVLLGDSEGDVRISDFGVVNLMPAGAMTSLNEQDRWLSGAEYLAPEQALGEGCDERTDVYAVGVLLYEMLTGRPPFVSGSGPATLKRVIYEKPLPLHLHKTVPGLSNDLEAVVMRALSKSPTGRFSSMSDLRQAIEHLTRKAAGEPDAAAADAAEAPETGGREHAATTVMEALPAGVIEAAKAEARAKKEAEAQAKAGEGNEDAKTTMVLTAAPTAAAAATETDEDRKTTEVRHDPKEVEDAKAEGRDKAKKAKAAQNDELPETGADLPKARRKRKKRTKKGPAKTVQAVGGAAAALSTDEADAEAKKDDEVLLTNRPDGEKGYAWEVRAVDGQAEVETEPQETVKEESADKAAADAEAKPAERVDDTDKAKDEATERETKESRSEERRAKARRKNKRAMTGEEAAVPSGGERRTRGDRRRARSGEHRAGAPKERVYTGEFEHVHPEASGGKGDDWFVSSAAEMAQADLDRHYMEDERKILGLSGSTFITLAVVGVLAVAFILMLASAADEEAPDLRPSAQAEREAKAAASKSEEPAKVDEADANDGGDVLTGGGGSQVGFLMGKAEQAFAQGRFLPPAAANVREYIDEIRGINPDNAFAKELEQRTADKLAEDARRHYKKRMWKEAHDSYDLLVRFAPWDEPAKKRLEELRGKLGLASPEGAVAEADAGAGDPPPAAAPAAPEAGAALAVAPPAAEGGGAPVGDAQARAAAVAALGGAPATPPPAVVKAAPAPKPKPATEPEPKVAKKKPTPKERPAPKKVVKKKAEPKPEKKVAAAAPVNAQDARRLVNEGRRKLRNAKYPDARKAFTDAINANPRSAAAHAGLGEVSFQMGRFADAVRYHRKAISLDRNNGKYHTSLANAYYKLREYARAIAHWKRALELDPSNSLARSYIRIAQQKLNSER